MKPRRLLASLLGVAISALSVAIAGHPAFAQVPPQVPPPAPGLADLLSNPGAWLTDMFHAALDLSSSMQVIANGALGAVTVWGGVNLMLNRHIRAPYHGALELVPRVLLSGIMVNFSLGWGQFVIDLNNVLCDFIGGGSIPGWGSLPQLPDSGEVLLNLLAMAIYLILGLLLMGQMTGRNYFALSANAGPCATARCPLARLTRIAARL